MSTKAVSSGGPIDHAAVQDAYSYFTQNKQLEVHANRPRTLVPLPISQGPNLRIDPELYAKCLQQTASKTDGVGKFFFQDLAGRTRFMNNETLDAFISFTKQTFPDLKQTPLYALVDTENNLELIPHDALPKGFLFLESNNLPIAFQASVLSLHGMTLTAKVGF